ncbi:hypothetical protein PIB30_083231 [Stylosanthes scabra]|uniref:Uncharacterized protein n=1 Tax=Stylosanthes scabra TaxID=79078 RepID=A0ABU6SUH7_9FABA|nr:hypothetical protein [Stylosanthes scabra]
MARDGGRGRGSGRSRGRPRKNTGIPLDLRTTPPTPTTTATTSTPLLSASQGPPIHMIPTPGVRVHSTEPGTSSQMPPKPSQPPRTSSGPSVRRRTLMVMVTTRMRRPPSPATLVPYCDGMEMIGTEQITTVFKSCYKWYVPHFHLTPEEAINTWWDEWKIQNLKAFRFQKGESEKMRDAWLARAAKRLRELFHGIREKGYPSDWIPDDIFKQLKEYWASDEYMALKRTNKANRASSAGGSLHTGGSITYLATAEKMSEVFTRTHTKKKDRGQWVDRRAEEANQQYEEELKQHEEERAALIAAGCPEPP